MQSRKYAEEARSRTHRANQEAADYTEEQDAIRSKLRKERRAQRKSGYAVAAVTVGITGAGATGGFVAGNLADPFFALAGTMAIAIAVATGYMLSRHTSAKPPQKRQEQPPVTALQEDSEWYPVCRPAIPYPHFAKYLRFRLDPKPTSQPQLLAKSIGPELTAFLNSLDRERTAELVDVTPLGLRRICIDEDWSGQGRRLLETAPELAEPIAAPFPKPKPKALPVTNNHPDAGNDNAEENGDGGPKR